MDERLKHKQEMLRTKLREVFAKMDGLLEAAKKRGQIDLSNEDEAQFKALEADAAKTRSEIEAVEEQRNELLRAKAPGPPAEGREETLPGKVRALRSNESLVTHLRGRALWPREQEKYTCGDYLQGIVSGNWRSEELRAMAEGTVTPGGAMVPTFLAAQIIDLARNKSVAFRAGAQLISMESNVLKFARVLTDPTGHWREENASITASDMTFDAVTFTAKVLAARCVLSVELAEDAPNAASTIQNALAQALATELDRVVLVGSGEGAEPAGILDADGVETVELGAGNGLKLGGYDVFLNAIATLLANNADEANLATIFAPRTWGTLSNILDGNQNFLLPPPAFTALKRLVSSQVPIDQTVGGSDDCSTIFTGDFRQVGIGMKTQLKIETSRSAEDAWDKLQVGIRAYLRADVQLLYPSHLHTTCGVRA
jgi:HK97 family phage major capsid protein